MDSSSSHRPRRKPSFFRNKANSRPQKRPRGDVGVGGPSRLKGPAGAASAPPELPGKPFKIRGARPGARRRDAREPSRGPSPSRRAAARALLDLERGEAFEKALARDRSLSSADRRLFREILYGTVRLRRWLDHVLSDRFPRGEGNLPPEIRAVLRLSAYQLGELDRVPARAVVHDAVNLARELGHPRTAGFVNAVLRGLDRRALRRPSEGEAPWESLGCSASLPDWLLSRWKERFGEDRARRIAAASNAPHPPYLNVRPGREEAVRRDLEGRGVTAEALPWPPGALRLRGSAGSAFDSESFGRGDWIVQDLAYQAMLTLVPVEEGWRIWDACAAPGGKTAALAWRTGEKGTVWATDVSPNRLERLKENLARLRLPQVKVLEGPRLALPPGEKCQLVWVDAPCSGTGVLSRRANLRWRLKPGEIHGHAERQRDLLGRVQGSLYAGGLLVYSTCTLEPEENEGVVEAFLAAHPGFRPEEPLGPIPQGSERRGPGLLFWPDGERDGGYLALFRRKG